MEQGLAEYRAKKKAELSSNSKNFSRPSSVKRTNAVFTLLSRWLHQITQSRFFVFVAEKLKQIPIIGSPTILKIILWVLLFLLFVELQFGIVFVIASGFLFMYLSTSTKRREKQEMSAYSVFNKNYEKLDGTFTAEQFEKELRHQPL